MISFSSLPAFFLSGFVSFLVSPGVIYILKKFKIFDDPKVHLQEKVIHTYPVPRGGGIPIFFGLLASLVFLPLDKHLKGIIAGAAVALVVGILDDLFEEKIPPLWRLLSNFLAAAIVVGAGISTAFINNPLGGIIRLDSPQVCFSFLGSPHCLWILADIFTIFWIAWTMNFVGWSGGIEGQLPGIVVIAALTIAGLSLKFSADITQWPVIILAMITAGAYLGFLPWNLYPQKIMPGYSGKSLAGFLLAVLSILSTAKILTLMIVLAIPLIDALWVISQRILSGRSPLYGGKREHLHHRLLAIGWSKQKITFFYWGITACLGILALYLNSQQKFYTMFMLVILFLGGILWLNSLSTSLKPPGQGNGSKI